MAEYIDRAELSVTPIDITDLSIDKCLMVYLAEDVDSLPTADVIERSEHLEQIKYIQDNLKTYIDNTRNEYYAMERSYNRLKAGVDKAIEEMRVEYNNIDYHANKLLGASYGIRKSIDILKRNIGE